MRRFRNGLAAGIALAMSGLGAQAAPPLSPDEALTMAGWFTSQIAAGGAEKARDFKVACDAALGPCAQVLARLDPARILRAAECPTPVMATYAKAGQKCLAIHFADGLKAEVAVLAEKPTDEWTGEVAAVGLSRP